MSKITSYLRVETNIGEAATKDANKQVKQVLEKKKKLQNVAKKILHVKISIFAVKPI